MNSLVSLALSILFTAVVLTVLGLLVYRFGGKALVLMNFGLSVIMATIGGVLLYDRVDWSNAPAAEGAPAGELVRRVERVTEYQGALPPADSAWRAARAALAAKEERRKGDLDWYADQLQLPRDGKGIVPDGKPAPERPILTVKFDSDGKGGILPNPVLDPKTGRPQMVPPLDWSGQPQPALHALNWYNDQAKDVNKNILDLTAALDALHKKDEELTNRLTGSKDGTVKGLTKRIQDEQAKRADIVAEEDLFRPLLINTYVDSQLILKRRTSLQDRVKELQAGVAKEPK